MTLDQSSDRKGSAGQLVNVLCLKWGDLYGAEYVNTLYAMTRRNLTLPLRFVCFTEKPDGLHPSIEVQPLPDFPEPPWEYARYCSAWRKLALFQKDLANLEGPCLFMDLEIVMLDNIDCFFRGVDGADTSLSNTPAGQSDVRMIENWYQPGKGQASVMAFDAGQPAYLLDNYLSDPQAVLDNYPTEQAYFSGQANQNCQFFPAAWCKSYKMHSMPRGLARFYRRQNHKPDGAKILVFHGRPNPPDAIAGRWGKRFPWFKRWYKRIHPSPWLSDYWRT